MFNHKNILEWDYGLRDIRKEIEHRNCRNIHIQVDFVGSNIFLSDQTSHRCAALDHEGHKDRPRDEELRDLKTFEYVLRMQRLARIAHQTYQSSNCYGLESTWPQPKSDLGSNRPSKAIIVELPFISPTAMPKSRAVLLEKIRHLLASNPVSKYEWIFFLVRDRLTNCLMRSLMRVAGLEVHNDFTSPVDYPVHVSTPKNVSLRGFCYRNPNYIENSVPETRAPSTNRKKEVGCSSILPNEGTALGDLHR